MRYQLNVPILAHERLGDFEYEITLQSPEVANDARPGQFMQVLYDHSYNPFTRRPFSVYRVDRERGTFTIVYLARGVFTQGLRNKQVGQSLSVVGPLGNWFMPDEDPDALHVMVGGGVGAPPLYFLTEKMVEQGYARDRIVVINGARTSDLLVGLREFTELGIDLRVTTDDGSLGTKGVVTDALREAINAYPGRAHVYTCGPTAMLRAVGHLCLDRGVPCQVSVETPMPCGLGVCMGCVVKIKDEHEPQKFSYQRSCFEGPVFPAAAIVWE